MSLPLDPALIRAEFPAFDSPALADEAFFENAGGSYMAAAVKLRLDRFLTDTRVQPYGVSRPSVAAGEAVDLAHERMAAALGVPADWIHFGPSTSANTYVLGHAFAGLLRAGDALIVTDQDHEANSGAWRKLAALGIEVRVWHIDRDTGHLDPADLDRLLDGKVKLAAFPHCSNIVGEINPVGDWIARVHAAGALAVVDGVSYAPHGLPDLGALDADIYLFSAYKTFGPHQGIMAIRPELARRLPNQSHFFNDDRLRYRLNPAGPDYASVAACAGVADYLERVAAIAGAMPGDDPFRVAAAAMHVQETALLEPLMDFLRGRNDLRLIGPTDPARRAPTVSIATAEPARAVAGRLASHGIMAGGSHFYAWRVLEALGIAPEHGVLRLSFLHYTTPDEITRLIAALDAEL